MKKTGKQLLAVILTVALTFGVVPLTPLAEVLPTVVEEQLDTDIPEAESTDNGGSQSPILAEDVSLREENIKHFRLQNGAYIAAMYPEPVHFEKAGGGWEEIDNTLVPADKLSAMVEKVLSGKAALSSDEATFSPDANKPAHYMAKANDVTVFTIESPYMVS